MLFNSCLFILGFLPIAYGGSYLIARLPNSSAYLWWMVVISVLFYSWQNALTGVIFVVSIVLNYLIGQVLVRRQSPHRYLWLSLGVGGNLLFIGYFKYLGFATATANSLFGTDLTVPAIALPLGISFYTFQQIAYLVDAYRGDVAEHPFVEYALFVSFFPQLIAGPIVQHRDVLSQFGKRRTRSFHDLDFAVGITLFSMGLFKKVVLADQFALFANPAFNAAERGGEMSALLAWIGVLSYSLQLYFDFSGYSDMALGLGRLFGIKLPLNFDSPYKSVDIIDFWRRWHMTLSSFLRDYLYFPLGGGRCSPWRRSCNLFLTMLLGGLWHGAGWTFVLWGSLHGLMLVINHAWNQFRGKDRRLRGASLWAARGATFLAVSLAWAVFRAESCTGAARILGSLTRSSNTAIDLGVWVNIRDSLHWIPLGMLIVWGLPNSQQILGRIGPALHYRLRSTTADMRTAWWQWRPTPIHTVLCASLFIASFCSLSRASQFIYFNF